jgi:hypothetical protein
MVAEVGVELSGDDDGMQVTDFAMLTGSLIRTSGGKLVRIEYAAAERER